jgi:hypothetical protein
MDEGKNEAEIVETLRRAAIETLAEILHNSGREAVEQRKIYRDDLPVKPFAEWKDLPEPAREGRRMMARYLLSARFSVIDLLKLV